MLVAQLARITCSMECHDLYGEKKSVYNILIMYLKIFFGLGTFSLFRKNLYFPNTPINLIHIFCCQL